LLKEPCGALPRKRLFIDLFIYLPIPQVQEVEVFIKQKKYQTRVDESWMNASERLRREYGLPQGAIFRIFPVDMAIDKPGDADHAYSFDWVEGKQYWFEIVRDPADDLHGPHSQEIWMVDPFGHVDGLVIPLKADIGMITRLWWKLLDVPEALTLDCARHNDLECHWGYRPGSGVPLVSHTLISDSNQGKVSIYDGSNTFKAEQIGRFLDVKVPTWRHAQSRKWAPTS
jgi:hypothetical protein